MTTDFAICTTIEGLEDLASSWDGLESLLDSPIGGWAWTAAAVETMGEEAELFAPLLRSRGSLVAAAALSRSRRSLGPVEQIYATTGEPTDFRYKDTASVRQLAECLAKDRTPLRLTRLPAESPVAVALRDAYARRALVISRASPTSPFIEIKTGDDSALSGLPKGLRSDLRRAFRRAEQIGAVRVETYAPRTEEELLPLWGEALQVEAAGWKGRQGSAISTNPDIAPFYRALALRAGAEGTLRILFLRLGREAAAMMIALETAERFWILKIGYDERFARCSPGLLLMEAGLRHAARQGLKTFEFLGGEAPWTQRWTHCGRPNVALLVYPYTPRGMALLLRDVARFVWSRGRRLVHGGSS
ncbi:MAG: GNAT family N-acetyltransferase [Thermoleophilia bacterium]|nr:GNAT family N-acetyltransferase [Thermoleophilia bacterium]